MSAKQDTKALKALAAQMGFDLVPAKTKKAKAKKNTFAKDMRAKRVNRRSATVLGGLTKVERSTLGASLGKNYTRAAWVKAVVALKAKDGITFTKAAVKAATATV